MCARAGGRAGRQACLRPAKEAPASLAHLQGCRLGGGELVLLQEAADQLRARLANLQRATRVWEG